MQDNLAKHLSPREYQIVELMILAGMTAEQVAVVLFIAASTVRKTLRNVYARLDVNSLIQLTPYYYSGYGMGEAIINRIEKISPDALKKMNKEIMTLSIIVMALFSSPTVRPDFGRKAIPTISNRGRIAHSQSSNRRRLRRREMPIGKFFPSVENTLV